MGPVESSRKALKRAGIGIDDVGVVEMNEAFASQAEACRRELRAPFRRQRCSAFRSRRRASSRWS